MTASDESTVHLTRGRDSASRAEWADALRDLNLADAEHPLEADDLDILAAAAYLVGELAASVSALERACERWAAAGEPRKAARSAFWLSELLLRSGDPAESSGWVAWARRLLEGIPDASEAGLLLVPRCLEAVWASDFEGAAAIAASIADIGERTGDRDVLAIGLQYRGRTMLRFGDVTTALGFLDESMLVLVRGGLSPYATGNVYCSMIEACQEMSELRRAQQWTEALGEWCDGQGMVMFTGQCLVHKAELLAVEGRWAEALEQVELARDRLAAVSDRHATGAAMYRRGEVLRMRGDLAAAEEAFEHAATWGYEPQPGLALLRVAQGRSDAAVATLDRMAAETPDDTLRSRLLPALIEVRLAAGDLDGAKVAAEDLARLAAHFGTEVLAARSHEATGLVLMAAGQVESSLVEFRAATRVWARFDAPYDTARLQARIGRACLELGDVDGGRVGLASARAIFERLGARPAVDEVDRLLGARAPTHGLSSRELEVLGLLGAGMTNRAIADQLSIAVKTVDRHVSNIFTKLGVTSRSAATAHAIRHGLI